MQIQFSKQNMLFLWKSFMCFFFVDGFEGWNAAEAQGGTVFLLDQKLDRISMPVWSMISDVSFEFGTICVDWTWFGLRFW